LRAWPPRNQILLCDGCDAAQHQQCAGVQQVPEGDWFCSQCAGASGAPSAGASAGAGKLEELEGEEEDEGLEKCALCGKGGSAGSNQVRASQQACQAKHDHRPSSLGLVSSPSTQSLLLRLAAGPLRA
jgi:hypothetical protein